MAAHRRLTFIMLFCFSMIVCLNICSAQVTKLWVVYDMQREVFEVKNTAQSDYIAVATYENSINQTGWAKLDVTTTAGQSGKYTDDQQTYAAGFVEGHITRSLISMHWINTVEGICPEPLDNHCQSLKNYLQSNMDWMQQQVKQYSTQESPYWYHVGLFLNQVAGLQDGYADNPGHVNMDIDVTGVYAWQVGGDMEDLAGLFPNSEKESVGDESLAMGVGHCSALLRLLPDFSDLYVAQDTWSDLPSMLRILKRYNFQLHLMSGTDVLIPGNTMTFSSYPGTLMSIDDFYAISSGLLTQETTIGNSNPDLQKYIKYTSVFEGIRTMVANRIAASGREWSETVAMYNSGTYNNQWMIVDYKRFQPYRKTPTPGTFYLLEQIPGTVEYHDLTDLLYNKTYFASYNIAYFPDIFNKNGGSAMVAKYGDYFTYEKTSRALIFKREVPKVKDIDSMIKLMRYNNFKEDPLSRCNCTPPYSAENAIACRDDLNPANGTYPFSMLGHRPHVATDMKLTNNAMFGSLSFLAVSSPTYDDLPPFQWSKSDYDKVLSHVGHPDLWNFPVITFNGSVPAA